MIKLAIVKEFDLVGKLFVFSTIFEFIRNAVCSLRSLNFNLNASTWTINAARSNVFRKVI